MQRNCQCVESGPRLFIRLGVREREGSRRSATLRVDSRKAKRSAIGSNPTWSTGQESDPNSGLGFRGRVKEVREDHIFPSGPSDRR